MITGIKSPKVDRRQYIDIPEGLTFDQLGYHRYLLKLMETKQKSKGKRFKILIDRRIKNEFKKAVVMSIKEAAEEAVTRAQVNFSAVTGSYERTAKILYNHERLGSFPTGIAALLSDVTTALISLHSNYWGSNRRFSMRAKVSSSDKPWHVPLEQRDQDGFWMCGGEFIIQIYHLHQAVTIFVLKNDSLIYKNQTSTFVPAHKIVPDTGSRNANRDRWASWRTMWAFSNGMNSVWMRLIADDEDLALLYKEFPSCDQLKRELIFRSRDFHVRDDLKPVVHWGRLGQIKNVEWRRTLMTIGTVKNYPEMLTSDDEGELYPLDSACNVLKITCPSTGRIYHLGVPTSHKTPSAARRWTLGLSDEFVLVQET